MTCLKTFIYEEQDPFLRPSQETIAVHYWGNSWLPSQSEQLKDLQHQLDMLRKDSYRLQIKMRKMEESYKNLLAKPKEVADHEIPVAAHA